MNRYLRGIICLVVTYTRFIGIKLIHWKGLYFSGLNILSPFTEIEIRGTGVITCNGLKTRSGTKIKVRNNAAINIGKGSALSHWCMIVCHEKVQIGENVQFGPNVLIFDHDHDFRAVNGLKNLKYKTSPITIGNNVWIGANTVILKGTRIGNNCIIGAGSVISGQIKNDTLVIQKRNNTEYQILDRK
ncbi:MAG: acyltransferase [Candidatus Omnitrophica bacterium]|nr:acyltransferase [Candidatus Omnitrophota bacterium]